MPAMLENAPGTLPLVVAVRVPPTECPVWLEDRAPPMPLMLDAGPPDEVPLALELFTQFFRTLRSRWARAGDPEWISVLRRNRRIFASVRCC